MLRKDFLDRLHGATRRVADIIKAGAKI